MERDWWTFVCCSYGGERDLDVVSFFVEASGSPNEPVTVRAAGIHLSLPLRREFHKNAAWFERVMFSGGTFRTFILRG